MLSIIVTWKDPSDDTTGQFVTDINGDMTSIRNYYMQDGGWLNIGNAEDHMVKIVSIDEKLLTN